MELHHANLIIGRGDCKDFVFDLLQKNLGFEHRGNPDFLLLEAETLGIDDSRRLEAWAMGKPLAGEAKVSVIIAKSLTFEAQNALLKVLEEPPLGTYFFICSESLGGILPTFLSRVRVLKSADPEEAAAASPALKFLKADIKGRLSLARSLAKKEDRSQLLELLGDLEAAAYENGVSLPALKDILAAKILASARGSSPKMLLEWLACVV